MALTFEKAKPKGLGFRKWYEQNRERLSAKRKKLYAENPEYRQRALEARKRRLSGEPVLAIPPDAPISLAQAAEHLGISISALRAWRRRKHFPEPTHHNRGLWFTEKQVLLLKKIKDFYKVYGKRSGQVKQELLNELVVSIAADWH